MYGNFYTISNHVWVVFEKKYPEDLEVYTPLGLQREEKDGQQEKNNLFYQQGIFIIYRVYSKCRQF